MSEAGRDNKSILSIKVLRLVKPSLVGPLALGDDDRDMVGDLWSKEQKNDITTLPGISKLTLGRFLKLPQGFGNMYLGETFSSYIFIHNESPITVLNIACKVELQTNTQKFLLSSPEPIAEMKPGGTLDIVLDHEVKEMGKHMLICTLTYSLVGATTGEPIVMERYFRFQVKKPLDVKTKLYNAENDEVYLEAQVHNITAGSMCLEKVELEPSSFFECSLLSASLTDSEKPLSEVGQAVVLGVDNAHQFLYRLTPRSASSRQASSIGKLDIVWRTSMGDKGRLQTSQLHRQPTPSQDLKLVPTKVNACTCDSPFNLHCVVQNNSSDREMDLVVELLSAPEQGYVWTGLTQMKAGSLSPSTSIELNLTALAIRCGVINVSGVRITDLNRGEVFCFNDFTQLMVLNSEPSSS